MKTLHRRTVFAALYLAIVCVGGKAVSAAAEPLSLTPEIKLWSDVHNSALAVHLSGIPNASQVADIVVNASNIKLKHLEAAFEVPKDRKVYPNSDDKCSFMFQSRRIEGEYGNILNRWTYKDLDDKEGWGSLNAHDRVRPRIRHANSDVNVSADISQLFEPEDVRDDHIRVSSGVHNIVWKADTQIDDTLDVLLPAFLYKYKALRYAALLNAPKNASKSLIKKILKESTKNVLAYAAGVGLGLRNPISRTAATRTITQKFTVYDVHPPVIRSKPRRIKLEATDFGGTLLRRGLRQMHEAIEASDKCGRLYSLSNDAPSLLPIGTTPVTWTITDRGPNPQGKSNKSSVVQRVTVEDTQAPIMVAPPSRVLETKASVIRGGSVELGMPRVVDLADPAPRIRRKGPTNYWAGTRSRIVWTATDRSNQSASATQWITVKKKGTNRAPKVQNAHARTLTSKPVNIVLRGSDADFLDGRFDPLSFRITRRPQHGEFIAPLYPFFIEDYRTKPSGPFGEAFRLAENRGDWLVTNYCKPNARAVQRERIPRDFVHLPQFVQVADDGTSYMIDHYWLCDSSSDDVRLNRRISKWDRDGNYLAETNYAGTNDSFVIDADGFIYVLRVRSPGSSSATLQVSKLRTSTSRFGEQVLSWKFGSSSAPGIKARQLSYARVDSERGLIYLHDRSRVFVFDVRAGGQDPVYLGTHNNGKPIIKRDICGSFGNSWSGFGMDVDSKGNVYLADTCSARIHKIAAPWFDDKGKFQIGDYVGWMGRCEGSTNKACDAVRKVSRGYSCTDETCQVDARALAGSGQGQFDVPIYLSIDPKNVLYVADYANARIQRFGPDGSFAGEAVSAGTGINQGDRPSFVLGNMGRPKMVTVNSSQFYVVDAEEQFVHVFETSPFKKITSNSVTVTYVSRVDFRGTDRFSFKSSDGLALSPRGTATIKVNRHHRPPRSLAISCYDPRKPSLEVDCVLLEDQSMLIRFSADDPDGIVGRDFLGLDRLEYKPFKPANGGLKLEAADDAVWTYLYQPKRNFNGKELIRFKVSDGRDSVTSMGFQITVSPVNDPPVPRDLNITGQGRGFPVSLSAAYVDIDRDPNGRVPGLLVDWGDGIVEREGEIVQLRSGGQEITGPLLTPGAPGSGYISGIHTYRDGGTKVVKLCLIDPYESSVTRCVARRVSIKEATHLTVGMSALDENPMDGDVVRFDLNVSNHAPEFWSGVNSGDLRVAVAIPPGLEFRRSDGSCVPRARGAEVLCRVGVLAPGTSRRVRLSLVFSAGVVPEPRVSLHARLLNAGNTASSQSTAIATVSPQWRDTDGDGLPDVWERNHSLNPLVANAGRDPDGDSASNLDEYLSGSHPNQRRSTPFAPYPVEGIGTYQSAKATFRLRRRPSPGKPDLAFSFGAPTLQPLVGDWNGKNGVSVGQYNPRTGAFRLKNRNKPGAPDLTFKFGGTGNTAIAGDWDGNGTSTVGVFSGVRREFWLRDNNKPGRPHYVIRFAGKKRYVPVVGDWDGDKRDSVGYFDPHLGVFLLRNSNTSGSADIRLALQGAAGKAPVVGDWNGDGVDDLGVHDRKTGKFLLWTGASTGRATLRFAFGARGTLPLPGGDWDSAR